MEGKIKLVTLSSNNIKEGIPVYWDGCPSKVKVWTLLRLQKENAVLLPNINSPRAQTPPIKELRTLVVEYRCFKNSSGVQHVPIKNAQWDEIIKEDEIGKVAQFKLIKGYKTSKGVEIVASIQRKRERRYTKAEMIQLAKVFKAVGGNEKDNCWLPSHEFVLKNYIKALN